MKKSLAKPEQPKKVQSVVVKKAPIVKEKKVNDSLSSFTSEEDIKLQCKFINNTNNFVEKKPVKTDVSVRNKW